jgi:hypothetical protein
MSERRKKKKRRVKHERKEKEGNRGKSMSEMRKKVT